jgi:hypothetical protein
MHMPFQHLLTVMAYHYKLNLKYIALYINLSAPEDLNKIKWPEDRLDGASNSQNMNA